MSFEFAVSDIDWVIALGVMFGLSLLITITLKKGFLTFMGFLTIFDAIFVYASLLEAWTLILCIIFLVGLIYYNYSKEKVI